MEEERQAKEEYRCWTPEDWSIVVLPTFKGRMFIGSGGLPPIEEIAIEGEIERGLMGRFIRDTWDGMRDVEQLVIRRMMLSLCDGWEHLLLMTEGDEFSDGVLDFIYKQDKIEGSPFWLPNYLVGSALNQVFNSLIDRFMDSGNAEDIALLNRVLNNMISFLELALEEGIYGLSDEEFGRLYNDPDFVMEARERQVIVNLISVAVWCFVLDHSTDAKVVLGREHAKYIEELESRRLEYYQRYSVDDRLQQMLIRIFGDSYQERGYGHSLRSTCLTSMPGAGKTTLVLTTKELLLSMETVDTSVVGEILPDHKPRSAVRREIERLRSSKSFAEERETTVSWLAEMYEYYFNIRADIVQQLLDKEREAANGSPILTDLGPVGAIVGFAALSYHERLFDGNQELITLLIDSEALTTSQVEAVDEGALGKAVKVLKEVGILEALLRDYSDQVIIDIPPRIAVEAIKAGPEGDYKRARMVFSEVEVLAAMRLLNLTLAWLLGRNSGGITLHAMNRSGERKIQQLLALELLTRKVRSSFGQFARRIVSVGPQLIIEDIRGCLFQIIALNETYLELQSS